MYSFEYFRGIVFAAGLAGLLQAFDQPIGGAVDEKLRRLQQAIGITTEM
jgi:hypothetical protein